MVWHHLVEGTIIEHSLLGQVARCQRRLQADSMSPRPASVSKMVASPGSSDAPLLPSSVSTSVGKCVTNSPAFANQFRSEGERNSFIEVFVCFSKSTRSILQVEKSHKMSQRKCASPSPKITSFSSSCYSITTSLTACRSNLGCSRRRRPDK